MRRYFIFSGTFVAVSVAVAFVSPQPAGAFVVNQNGVARAAAAANTVVDVKHNGPPPGWHHGRKRGWHGHGEPPGLAKKP